MVSAVLILTAGCTKASKKLTQEDLKAERQRYVEAAAEGLKQVEKMGWYEDDYKLVAVTPVSPISADKMSTAEIRQTYRGSEYTGDVTVTGCKDMIMYFVDDDGAYHYCRVNNEGVVTARNRFGKTTDQIGEDRFFVSSQAFDCTYEKIEMARQKGDYIISGGEGSADSMTFFIDASEIA